MQTVLSTAVQQESVIPDLEVYSAYAKGAYPQPLTDAQRYIALRSNCNTASSSVFSGPQFTRPQFTGLLGLRQMLESYHKLQSKPKTVPEFKDAIQLIWSVLLEKVIDNAVKDCRKRLRTRSVI